MISLSFHLSIVLFQLFSTLFSIYVNIYVSQRRKDFIMNYFEELEKLAEHQKQLLTNVNMDEVLAMADAIIAANRIYVAGWGRAGNNIKMLSMDCSQIGLHTHIVGDNSTPSIHEGDILVIGSGSGKTASMQLFAQQAKSHGAKVGLICGAVGSPIEKMADLTIHIVDASHTNGDYRATKGVMTEVERLVHADAFYPVMQTVCDFIRAVIAEKIGVTPEQMYYNHNNIE